MSIRIIVKSAELQERSVKGRPVWEQTAYAVTCDRNNKPHDFPEKVRLTIWSDKQGNRERDAYPPGEYLLAPSSFYVGDYGAINVSPRLVPAQVGAKV